MAPWTMTVPVPTSSTSTKQGFCAATNSAAKALRLPGGLTLAIASWIGALAEASA